MRDTQGVALTAPAKIGSPAVPDLVVLLAIVVGAIAHPSVAVLLKDSALVHASSAGHHGNGHMPFLCLSQYC